MTNLTRYYANAHCIGLRDFQTELQNWPMKQNLLLNTKYHGIDWLSICLFTLTPPTKPCGNVEAAAWNAGKKMEQHSKIGWLTQIEHRGFWWLLYVRWSEFCRHNFLVDTSKDQLGPKVQVLHKEKHHKRLKKQKSRSISSLINVSWKRNLQKRLWLLRVQADWKSLWSIQKIFISSLYFALFVLLAQSVRD